MKTKNCGGKEREVCLRNDSGLTLIEVLVVLAMIFILAALLWPPASYHPDRSVRVKCLNNLKQLDLGLIQYGMENNDRLPEIPAGQGHWAWEMPVAVTNVLERQGVTRDILYDPGFLAQYDDRFWNAAPGKYCVIGYALALGGPGSSVTTSNQNSVIQSQDFSQSNQTAFVSDPSTRVLVACATITPAGQNNTKEMASYNWTSVRSSFPDPHRSPHLEKNRKLPVGGNEAMLDGSGRWVKWHGMIPRTSGPADVATFWW